MNDPLPENITGEKRHVFEHHVNWSHVVLGVLILVALWKVGPVLAEDRDDTDRFEG